MEHDNALQTFLQKVLACAEIEELAPEVKETLSLWKNEIEFDEDHEEDPESEEDAPEPEVLEEEGERSSE